MLGSVGFYRRPDPSPDPLCLRWLIVGRRTIRAGAYAVGARQEELRQPVGEAEEAVGGCARGCFLRLIRFFRSHVPCIFTVEYQRRYPNSYPNADAQPRPVVPTGVHFRNELTVYDCSRPPFLGLIS